MNLIQTFEWGFKSESINFDNPIKTHVKFIGLEKLVSQEYLNLLKSLSVSSFSYNTMNLAEGSSLRAGGSNNLKEYSFSDNELNMTFELSQSNYSILSNIVNNVDFSVYNFNPQNIQANDYLIHGDKLKKGFNFVQNKVKLYLNNKELKFKKPYEEYSYDATLYFNYYFGFGVNESRNELLYANDKKIIIKDFKDKIFKIEII